MSGPDVVIFASRDWWEYQRRPHYTALSRLTRVLVVEPPLTPFALLPARSRRDGRPRLRRLSESLHVYRPVACMPYGLSFRNDALARLNGWSLAPDIRRVIRRLGFGEWVQVFFLPQQDCLLGLLDPALRCFEVVDEYTTLTGPDRDLDDWHDCRVLQVEPRILEAVDVVFTTSRTLYEVKRGWNRNTYCVPNAADTHHFTRARAPGRIPPDLQRIPGPRIGFVGHLTDFFDVCLLRAVATRQPDWSWVLLGEDNTTPGFRETSKLAEVLALPNVHWLGRKSYEELPEYLRGFQACTMPYQPCDRMKYSHPNKIYQYLAAGKPVVSTDFPAAHVHEDVIDIAATHCDFEARLQEALGNGVPPPDQARRIAIAEANSVESRAARQFRIMQSHLQRRRRCDL